VGKKADKIKIPDRYKCHHYHKGLKHIHQYSLHNLSQLYQVYSYRCNHWSACKEYNVTWRLA